jgi:hypothetical protein
VKKIFSKSLKKKPEPIAKKIDKSQPKAKSPTSKKS